MSELHWIKGLEGLESAFASTLASDGWRGRRDLEPIVAAVGYLLRLARKASTEGLSDEEITRAGNAANVLRGGRVGSGLGAFFRAVIEQVTAAVEVLREDGVEHADAVAEQLCAHLADVFGEALRSPPAELGAWLRTSAALGQPSVTNLVDKIIRVAVDRVPADTNADDRYRLLRFDVGNLDNLYQRIASARKPKSVPGAARKKKRRSQT